MQLLNRSMNKMNVWSRRMTCAIGCAVVGFASNAHAGCSPYEPPKPTSMNRELGARTGFLPALFEENAENEAIAPDPHSVYAIVGLWKVNLVSKGTKGVKDGTPIDFGYQTWHSDGTEILNSGMRPPLTSSFCMGVWQRLSYHHYTLNHVTLSWDSTGTVYVGPGNIREDVAADADGNNFAGTFEIIQYATDEKTVLADVKGTVTGKRVSPL